MSWSISLNGHKDQPDNPAIEKLALDITRLAKEADVGLTHVSVTHSQGSKAVFSSSTELDETLVEEGDDS